MQRKLLAVHPFGVRSQISVSALEAALTRPRATWIYTLRPSFGQETLSVPDMPTKYAFQVAGLGFGILQEPKPDDTFHLAWRTGDEGAALQWWIDRVRTAQPFAEIRRAMWTENQLLAKLSLYPESSEHCRNRADNCSANPPGPVPTQAFPRRR